MSKEFEARMRAIKELKEHLTEEECHALAAWASEHLGDGEEDTTEWPGWTVVAIRVAAQESSQFVTKLANFCYFAACILTVALTVLSLLFGFLAVMGVIEYHQGAEALIEGNLVAASKVVFVLTFCHVVGKFVARQGLRRARIPPSTQ